MPGEPSWAMRRGIRLYTETALAPQTHPHLDPHGTFNSFLEAGVVGGLPDAKWYNLCL